MEDESALHERIAQEQVASAKACAQRNSATRAEDAARAALASKTRKRKPSFTMKSQFSLPRVCAVAAAASAVKGESAAGEGGTGKWVAVDFKP